MRERDAEKARVLRVVPRFLFCQLPPRARCACGAMMAIRDIQRGNAGKCGHERITVASDDAPERMMHAVRGLEIGHRVASRRAVHDQIDVRIRPVRQKYGPGLRAKGQHVTGAIVFLVRPRPLVLPDDVAVVLVERRTAAHAHLHVSAHAQLIDIDARLLIDDQRAVAEGLEVASRTLVHSV